MSLHIGNLSTGTRVDDLQRVFRRFGRCTVRVKDKYGFVVYDYPAGAEKALNTLRGTRICGQAITISWSNRQPRNMQRHPIGEKSNEQPHGRYSVKESAHRRLGSYGQRENEMNSREADGKLRTGSSDLIYESTRYRLNDSKPHVRENSHTSLTDHHGIGDGRKNRLNASRWDKQAVDPLNEIYLENNLEFDRYEPHNSDSKKELDEPTAMSPLVGSPSVKKIQDSRGLSYNEKSQKSCYTCGEVGHKRSNCPLEPKRHVSGCRGMPHPSGETVPLSSQDSDREPSTSRSHQRLLRCGDSSTKELSAKGKGNEFKDKKRNWRDYESQDKSRFKRARGSSSPSSDYTSSRSQSPSRSSQPSSRFKLKSVHSDKISLPSSYGSSPSRHSGSMSPTSSLLPKEVNQNVSPSSNKAQEKSKGSLANGGALQQSADMFKEETQLRRTAGAIRTQSISFSIESKCEAGPANMEQEGMPKDKYGDEHIVDNLSLHSMKGMRGLLNEQHVAATESSNPVKSNASSSSGMSLEEVHMVLKHYGLQQPEENEKDLPVKVYFGSARFWPWEMIYYRRLKKGPISAENYSRRIAQNAEFGIVDRHVRGSSGWGEVHEKNT